MRSIISIAILAIVALASSSIAHPGDDHEAEAAARRSFIEHSPHLQKRCASTLQARGHTGKAIERRRALAENMRSSLGLDSEGKYLKARDLNSVLATDHNQTLLHSNVTLTTPQDDVFGDASSCVLQPNMTLAEGPYYVSGEFIRKNAIEDLVGIKMIMDVQLIDVQTCEPVSNTYVEFWQANQTGVYSGTVGNGNGNANDASNLNNTWLRAIQPTDNEGVVQVELIFPGHYAPRATHTHILVHQGGHVLPNNTFTGGNVSHVGQVFFDQDLINEIDTFYPYTTNPNAILPNSKDMALASEAVTTDPVVNYVYVGESAGEGLVTWITVGIDTSAIYDLQTAAWLTADGGVENPVQPNAGGQ